MRGRREREKAARLLAKGKKRCFTCKKIKLLELFNFDIRSKDKKSYQCSKCAVIKFTKSNYRKSEKRLETREKWNNDNKDHLKEYRKINRSKIQEKTNKRYQEDEKFRNKIIAESKKYRSDPKNKPKIRATQKRLNAEYKINDPSYRILGNLRRKMLLALEGKRKADFSLKLIGCTRENLMTHLESQFKEGMNWDNYGLWKNGEPMTWHIDHIIPCATFDFTKEEDQRKCFHYTNLQPLWANENLSKGWKIPNQEEKVIELDLTT